MTTRSISGLSAAFCGLYLFLATPAAAGCPADSAQVGPVCVDEVEASVWDLSAVPANKKAGLIKKIKAGTATEAALLAAGAVQRGVSSDDYPCDDDGNDCTEIYAVSIPGVTPSRFITWFQAQQAAANSGKRLLTNAEWQMAAAGTVDPGTNNGLVNTMCNTAGGDVRETGLAGATPAGADSCVSRWEVQDMVGNLWEWVADWVPLSTACPGWASVGTFSSDDAMCLAGASTTSGPGALIRGGNFLGGTDAGVFAVRGFLQLSHSVDDVGFRAAR